MATGYDVDQLLEQGRSRWLTNAELLFILENHDSKMIRESVPQLPASGSLFLYNKNITPSFRRDGHKWRKKPSGRVSESHEPLTVHGVKVIECYYATREDFHDFKRRSYWMLNGAKKHIVLVHYRDTTEGKTNTESIVKFSAGQSCSNPHSEVNLSVVVEQPQMDHFENLTADRSLTTSVEAEWLPFQVFKEQHATLQHGRDDGIVSHLADKFTWQEIACLSAPQEAENFGGTPVCLEMTPIPDCYPMLLHPDQVQMPQLGTHSSLTIIPQHKFEIRALSPDWCFADEGTKVVIIGSFHCDPSEYAWALFGGSKVPIEIMQDGVICCHAPPNFPGKVTFCITSANGELCSEEKDFEYCDKYIRLQQEENRNIEEAKLLVKFEQMLLSDLSLEKGESSFNFQERPLLRGCDSSSGIKDRLLQVLLKNNLQQWLFARSLYGDGNLSCTLSKNEKEIIHVVGGLGYEWALDPILNSGIGVDFRDANGWTAVHWAARFGREQMVAALIANGASADLLTDPTEEHPIGQIPADIAYAYGHKEMAGYLFEKALTMHLSLYVSGEASSVHVEADVDVNSFSMSCSATFEDERSMHEVLRAVRNVSLATKRIQEAFRFHSFRRRQQSETANHRKVDEYGFIYDEIQGQSGAGLRAYKRQKLDRFPRGKAKLVEVSTNEEESAASLFGTSLLDKDNVDPLQSIVGTFLMDDDNDDPFPSYVETPTDSPGYSGLWS